MQAAHFQGVRQPQQHLFAGLDWIRMARCWQSAISAVKKCSRLNGAIEDFVYSNANQTKCPTQWCGLAVLISHFCKTSNHHFLSEDFFSVIGFSINVWNPFQELIHKSTHRKILFDSLIDVQRRATAVG
jgi:hypothetical protein